MKLPRLIAETLVDDEIKVFIRAKMRAKEHLLSHLRHFEVCGRTYPV